MKDIIKVLVNKITKKKVKLWFALSVAIGLLPIAIKLGHFLVYLGKNNLSIQIDISDFLVFGLILNIGNIFQMIHLHEKRNDDMLAYVITSVFLIVFFACLYWTYLSKNVEYNMPAMLIGTLMFIIFTFVCAISFLTMEEVKNAHIN